jgi:hypothetical protein
MSVLLIVHIIAFSVSLASVPLLSLAAFQKIRVPRAGITLASFSTIAGFITGIALAISTAAPMSCILLSVYLAVFFYLRNYVATAQLES